MPILNLSSDLMLEATAWRRHLHATPELGFDTHQTSAFVAEKLRAFGCDEVITGLARTGVVGIISGGQPGPTIGLRADMDALPIVEETDLPWASRSTGRMHACGHDGHTAMLLGAAKYLASTRNFSGRVAVIFQPAEEDGGGGEVMVREGLMERFEIEKVFGMHNKPDLPIGNFALCEGPIMAATLEFELTIKGKGGHAARPHDTIDPIVIGSQIVGALQTVVARSTDPLDALVVSVTTFHAGTALNIIPSTASLSGTIRALRADVIESSRQRIAAIVSAQAEAYGAIVEVKFIPSYPATFNHPLETGHSNVAARHVAGPERVDAQTRPEMGGEDFSYMLEARPGSYILLGNGEGPSLHNPAYDFNDEAIPFGVSYWVYLVEGVLGGRPL